MPLLLWIWNNKRWTLIILLLIYAMFQTWQSNSLAGDLNKAKADCKSKVQQEVDKAVKPYQDAITNAKEQKVITEKAWSDKYIESQHHQCLCKEPTHFLLYFLNSKKKQPKLLIQLPSISSYSTLHSPLALLSAI